MVIFRETREFLTGSLGAAVLAAALAACAPPAREDHPVVDLRVCVENEAAVEAYRRFFKTAVFAEPRGGRSCDVVVQTATMHAGKVTVRSAYNGEVLAEIEGTVDLAPNLAHISLDQHTDAYRRVWAQRKAAGFAR